jgi:ABC-2 type transport system permease protein
LIARIVSLALKDLKILSRDRLSLFWTLGFPLLIAIFFGSVFGGGGSGEKGKLSIAWVDHDKTPTAVRYFELLSSNKEIAIDRWDEEQPAIDAVRRGQRVAVIVIEKGFGASPLSVIGAGGGEPLVRLGVDPGRSAEGGLLTGVMMKSGFDLVREELLNPAFARSFVQQQRDDIRKGLETDEDLALTDRATAMLADQFLGTLDTFIGNMDEQGFFEGEEATDGSDAASGLQFDPASAVGTITIEREQRTGPVSGYEIAFPQGICWAVIGCVMSFAMGLVIERRRGTLTRLQLAPIRTGEILAGKGLACMMACGIALTLVMLVGTQFFGVRVPDLSKMIAVLAAVAFCFTGVMLLIAVLGKTEGAVGGAGNAALLVMAMFGGGMIPLFILPKWMVTVGSVSPVKWSILAVEGAIWRGFAWGELMTPVAILLSMGIGTMLVAAWRFRGLLQES